MNAVGIVAEYNPLHNGHVYHMSEARELSGCDRVVVAMSGDYVQRGEPAVLGKWTRAALALSSGADLVIEIPALFCLGDAGQYAGAGVKLLEAAGCSHMAFGSESGDLYRLSNVADMLNINAEEFAEKIRELTKTGMSFPAARELAYFEASGSLPEDREILNNPNDSLAVEYLRAMKAMAPVAVRRVGGGYHDIPDPEAATYAASVDDVANKYEIENGNEDAYENANDFISASAVRRMLMDGGDVSRYIPMTVLGALAAGPITYQDAWMQVLRYAVMSLDAEKIDECPSGGEGLGSLIKTEVMRHDSWDGLVHAVKSKRYTYTRISRLLVQIMLGISREEFKDVEPSYIRVLGFTDKGREILRELKNSDQDSLPVITNINKESGQLTDEGRKLLRLDIHAADIYNLVTGRDTSRSSDHRMKPATLIQP